MGKLSWDRLKMAFGRICELNIGSSASGLVVSGLDIDFEVNRSITFAENSATFTIYNAKEETINTILTTGNNVNFKVGYDDEVTSSVFIGNIRESNTKKTNTGNITELFCITGGGSTTALATQYLSLSYGANSSLSTIINSVASSLSLTVFGLENITDIVLQNGFVFVGKANNALVQIENILRANDKAFYRDNDELVIYNKGSNSKFTVVILSPSGGLLRVEKITDKDSEDISKYRFNSIMIPQLQINGLVQYNNVIYTVSKLKYYGNNYGGDFNIEGEMYA